MSDMLPDIPPPPVPQQSGDGKDVFSLLGQTKCPFCDVFLKAKPFSLSFYTLNHESVSLEGVAGLECPSCGSVVYQQEAMEQIERARMGK